MSDENRMHILITGATGFLGAHLSKRLETDGHAPIKLGSRDADLTQANSLAPFNDKKVDLIYHLAAWTQAGDFCLHHQGEQWLINQLINTHVLQWWQAEQPQAKLIAMGSSCCYPDHLARSEENFLRDTPTETLLTYGMTKRMLYTGLDAMRMQYGLRYLLLIPSTLYGPDYHLDGRQMHFIFDLIRKIVDARYGGPEVVLWGDGSQTRELIHVGDFVNAMVYLAGRVDNEIVNLGSQENYSIRWYAETICDLVGYDPALIQYDTSRYVGTKDKFLVLDKLKTLMPEFKVTNVRNGLEEVIVWYKEARGYAD